MNLQTLRTTCCIAGGGPAGIMLGFLLARAGVEVAVLEKHADFFRDFRGDTVHPSTLELIGQLGLLDAFLALPHQEVRALKLAIGDREIAGPDFSHLPTRCKFIALLPQWDFLDFLARHAKRYPAFQLRMSTEVTGVLEESGRIVGVTARTAAGELEVHSELPFIAEATSELTSWDQVKLLTVQVNRLRRWYRPGLLCLGDAAHAMSPAGGVGINLAIQDAVAAANRLAGKLRLGALGEEDLRAIQRRREPAVRKIQAGQVFVHRHMFGKDGRVFTLPWLVRMLLEVAAPLLRRAGARIVGLGFQPERIETPDVLART